MRVTVSSAKSLRLAKETNKKIAVTAGVVMGRSCRAPFFFALPFAGGRTCWTTTGREETLQTATRPRDSAGQRSSVLLVQEQKAGTGFGNLKIEDHASSPGAAVPPR